MGTAQTAVMVAAETRLYVKRQTKDRPDTNRLRG